MQLHEILAAYSMYDVEYANQLTNHLPMALVALERLGATEERKHEFASEYLRSKSIKKISASDKELRISEDGLPAWEKIFPRAIQSSDEHVIKFVYTCFEESQIYDNPAYQALAAEKVGLAPTRCS